MPSLDGGLIIRCQIRFDFLDVIVGEGQGIMHYDGADSSPRAKRAHLDDEMKQLEQLASHLEQFTKDYPAATSRPS